jgi:hypothetical protein
MDPLKKSVLFVLLSLVSTLGIAQSDFRDGFILMTATDTVFGMVDFRESLKVFSTCTFKRSKDQTPTTYTPDNITGYGFKGNKFFESREIVLPGQESKLVFLEVIVRGKINLYRYEKIFLLQQEGQKIHPLNNDESEIVIDGKRLSRNSNQYIGILSMLMGDCPFAASAIREARLVERSLTEVVEGYNRCIGSPSISYKANKPWVSASIGVAGGLNISNLSLDGSSKHLAGSFEASRAPVAGIFLDIGSPRLSERFSFHTGLIYLNSTYYKFSILDNTMQTYRNYVTIDLTQLKLPLGIKYTLPQKKYTPYLNGGIASTIQLESKSLWTQEFEAGGIVGTEEGEGLAIKNSQFGFWGGCGVQRHIHKKITSFIELRYEMTGGISPNTQGVLSSTITNFQIFVGLKTR